MHQVFKEPELSTIPAETCMNITWLKCKYHVQADLKLASVIHGSRCSICNEMIPPAIGSGHRIVSAKIKSIQCALGKYDIPFDSTHGMMIQKKFSSKFPKNANICKQCYMENPGELVG